MTQGINMDQVSLCRYMHHLKFQAIFMALGFYLLSQAGAIVFLFINTQVEYVEGKLRAIFT